LAKPRWSKLSTDYGIEESNYGTVRLLEGSPLADRKIVGRLRRPILDDRPQIVIESLGPEITLRYRESGLEFYPPTSLDSSFLTNLNSAIELISNVPDAAVAVSSVLSVIHILKPDILEYDVSYSEPSLPFSIFVGVSLDEQINSELRIVPPKESLDFLGREIIFLGSENRFVARISRRQIAKIRKQLEEEYSFEVRSKQQSNFQETIVDLSKSIAAYLGIYKDAYNYVVFDSELRSLTRAVLTNLFEDIFGVSVLDRVNDKGRNFLGIGDLIMPPASSNLEDLF
jgi:hypothetical protein